MDKNQAKHSVENHETKEKINLLGEQEMGRFSKTLSILPSQESKIEIKQEENGTYTIEQEDYHSYDIDELDEEDEEKKSNNPTEEISEKIREKILTKTKRTSYKAKTSSSERRQMILNSLSESINDATLDSILKDKRCSRGVKTALLLSPDLTYEQKLKVVDSAKNNEIVAYCQKHKNVFPQVRSALTPTSKVIQVGTQFISKDSPTNLNRFVNAFFDQNRRPAKVRG